MSHDLMYIFIIKQYHVIYMGQNFSGIKLWQIEHYEVLARKALANLIYSSLNVNSINSVLQLLITTGRMSQTLP